MMATETRTSILKKKGGDSEDENGEFETDEESSEERQDFDFDDDFDGFDGYLNRNDGPNVATAPVTPPTRQTLFDLASPPPSTEAWSHRRRIRSNDRVAWGQELEPCPMC